MPNKERIRKWVDALRSGEYEQARRRLRDGQGAMCCLGVACEVHRKETGEGEWRGIHYGVGAESNFTNMPIATSEWFGLNRGGNPVLNVFSSIEVDCVDLNDRYDYDFNQIADAIERTYL